jgi:hypothetical protein
VWWLPSRLKSSGGLCAPSEIFIGRAPEEETSGDAADRDRNTDLCRHPHDAILHRGGTRAFVSWVAVLPSERTMASWLEIIRIMERGARREHTKLANVFRHPRRRDRRTACIGKLTAEAPRGTCGNIVVDNPRQLAYTRVNLPHFSAARRLEWWRRPHVRPAPTTLSCKLSTVPPRPVQSRYPVRPQLPTRLSPIVAGDLIAEGDHCLSRDAASAACRIQQPKEVGVCHMPRRARSVRWFLCGSIP